MIDGVQILHGQKIAGSIGPAALSLQQFVRFSAGSHAPSPVAAPVSDQAGHKAVSGVGNTQRTVNKHLDGDLCSFSDFFYICQIHLTCQHHTVSTHFFEQHRTFQVVHTHLRRTVNFHISKVCRNIIKHRQILHDNTVNTDAVQCIQLLSHIADLVFKNDSVHGYVYFHIPQVSVANRLRQRVDSKVV